jgi:hypothetical protein
MQDPHCAVLPYAATLNPKAETQTRNPKPETRNPKPETRDPKPETRDPKIEIRDPKPETGVSSDRSEEAAADAAFQHDVWSSSDGVPLNHQP